MAFAAANVLTTASPIRRAFETSKSFLGHSVGEAGDVDGDSFDDVIVGAISKNGTGMAQVISGKDASALFTFFGDDGSNSSTHFLVLASPDCIAVLAGRKMRTSIAWRPSRSGQPNARAGAVARSIVRL